VKVIQEIILKNIALKNYFHFNNYVK